MAHKTSALLKLSRKVVLFLVVIGDINGEGKGYLRLTSLLIFLSSSSLISTLLAKISSPSFSIDSLNLAHEFDLDFDDAFQFYLCHKYNLRIVSYDKHFDKLPIKKVEPKDVDV